MKNILIVLLLAFAQYLGAQNQAPIIDMHIHCFGDEQHPGGKDYYGNRGSESGSIHFTETYDRFKKYNIVKAVVSYS